MKSETEGMRAARLLLKKDDRIEQVKPLAASTCSAWVLGELESLRNGIMQAHMKGAEYGDQVLMACMRAHHEAANQAIEKLGGEVVPLANLEALTQNEERTPTHE